MGYTERVDQIYNRGTPGNTGFVGDDGYATYLAWRQYAIEADGGNPIAPAQAATYLDADRVAGRLDYTRGYLPLYNLFVLGQVSGGGGGGGDGIGDLLNNKLLVAGAVVAAVLLLKK